MFWRSPLGYANNQLGRDYSLHLQEIPTSGLDYL
jgi:hypothetical protein